MDSLLAFTIVAYTSTRCRHTILTTEGDSVEQHQLCAGQHWIDQVSDFIVGLICHPAVDHLCIFLTGFQKHSGYCSIELGGLVSERLTQIHVWEREQRIVTSITLITCLLVSEVSNSSCNYVGYNRSVRPFARRWTISLSASSSESECSGSHEGCRQHSQWLFELPPLHLKVAGWRRKML